MSTLGTLTFGGAHRIPLAGNELLLYGERHDSIVLYFVLRSSAVLPARRLSLGKKQGSVLFFLYIHVPSASRGEVKMLSG